MERKTMIIERYPVAGTERYAIRAVHESNHIDPVMQLKLAATHGCDSPQLVMRLTALGHMHGFTHVTYIGNWARWARMQPKDGPL